MNMDELALLKEVLPASPGILGREKFFNAAVLIPLVEIDGQPCLLFEKRSAAIRQGGEICFPGGRYEPEVDVDFQSTAIRETEEELGITASTITLIGQLDTVVTLAGITVESFIARIRLASLEDLLVNQAEVAEAFCLPVAWFEQNEPKEYTVRIEIQPTDRNEAGDEIVLFPTMDLGLPSRYAKPWGGKKQTVYVYETAKGVIWGITAELIREFVRKLSLARNKR